MPNITVPNFDSDSEIAVFVKDSSPCTLGSTFGVMRDELIEKIQLEEKKYALTEREKIFVDAIYDLLDVLDRDLIQRVSSRMR